MKYFNVLNQIESVDESNESAAAEFVQFAHGAASLWQPVDVIFEYVHFEWAVHADVIDFNSIRAVEFDRFDQMTLVITPEYSSVHHVVYG